MAVKPRLFLYGENRNRVCLERAVEEYIYFELRRDVVTNNKINLNMRSFVIYIFYVIFSGFLNRDTCEMGRICSTHGGN
jgi:hypothetical protein